MDIILNTYRVLTKRRISDANIMKILKATEK